jgi:hypothetical protein
MNGESRGLQKEVVVTYSKVVPMPVRTEENYTKP